MTFLDDSILTNPKLGLGCMYRRQITFAIPAIFKQQSFRFAMMRFHEIALRRIVKGVDEIANDAKTNQPL